MRISLNWLKELVEVNLSPEELATTLTIAGFEVEDLEDRRSWADGVIVGKVIECVPHPNANKLSVCQVDVGTGELANIVCGAPNVKAGIFVPVATVGTFFPKIDLKIKSAKLRGVRSEGMICSLAELGLAKESEGIHIFPPDELKVGQDVRPWLGLDDVILDLTATANRADALSMVGVAREVAALTGGKLSLPTVEATPFEVEREKLKLKIAENQACPAYIGTVIEGLKIAPSPRWLQWRLEAAGVRPINNVVDATNYILLEWGQPLHAFDGEKLIEMSSREDLTIGVRFARENEVLTTLDGQKRDLTAQNLLITIDDRPCALAGVMGGEDSEVDCGTENIVLEAALFEPVAIRRSAKSQSLRTESSARYERGVNQVELETALNRAIALITELAGGKVVAQAIADNRPAKLTNTIELRLSRINHVLGKVNLKSEISRGLVSQADVVAKDSPKPLVKAKKQLIEIPSEDVERILADLGCKLESMAESPKFWRVTTPPYRYRDLEREIDLIEEVARLYGYDRFDDTLPAKTEPGYLSFRVQMERKLRACLRGLGLTEIVQYSLVKPSRDEIVLANPLFSEYSALRTNLIDGLITAFEYNQAQGNGALNGFEMGRIFWREGEELKEGDSLAGIMGGDFYPQGRWTRGGKPAPMSWYEAKGILESFFSFLGLSVSYQAETKDARLHPGRTASLWLNGTKLGIFGQLHPQLRQERDLIAHIYVFELNLETLSAVLEQENLITPHFRPYSPYPAVARDLAFFAPTALKVGDITQLMQQAGGKTLETVELFDQYQGENVPSGQRSLAFRLVYRSDEGTLKDAEVEPIHNKIRDALVKQFEVTLRS
jgi:phenylalanyl-tRNA synthetase beta chain